MFSAERDWRTAGANDVPLDLLLAPPAIPAVDPHRARWSWG
jgi:hypothetical protein